ncbi:MAG: UDP-N-acetylmuramoyl-L-alanine--D-glutamate ligase [Acidobacteria bacterium]|nr:UDP-N-acetylmuramoyl-L-alanine--D-glutamate ligase [Acidobacteriota bacterium]MBI3280646.1 UDP-N-acetylmuramoyl-L-alanine--D-glutamate ligase [Acidobacteriota bacterium]
MKRLAGKRVAVIGMARSGMAAVELVLRHGASALAIDQRSAGQLGDAAPRLQSWGVALRPQTAESLRDAELVVLSPGVPVDIPELEEARGRGLPVIGELELASWFLQGPVIGITGSNGKTTTTALTGHILREGGVPVQVGGNIGTPPAAMIDASRPEQWNVLELSSFQLETIREFRARVSVVLNVTPDHLDRHHTFEHYAAAKRRLLETQTADDFAVLNADDVTCVDYGASTKARPVWFSSTRPVTPGLFLEGGRIYLDDEPLIEAAEVPLRGVHNLENVMAASAAARIAGGSRGAIAAAIRTFPGVEHRLEFVREIGGVAYYNDSKATNVDATHKALDAFPGGLWVILGGKDKGSDYTALREPLRRKARAVLLIGAAASKIAEHLNGAAPVIRCGTIDEAVRRAARAAVPGEVVLLAPACASFDQFDSFEHRGRVFKELVNRL